VTVLFIAGHPFPADCTLALVSEDSNTAFESGLGAAGSSRAKDLKNMRADRAENDREGTGLQYDWEWEDGKCGEGMLFG
jgi:hypothetical protein